MVEYKKLLINLKGGGTRNYYYKIYKNGIETRINKNDYILNGGYEYDTCRTLLKKNKNNNYIYVKHKFLSKFMGKKECPKGSHEINFGNKICCSKTKTPEPQANLSLSSQSSPVLFEKKVSIQPEPSGYLNKIKLSENQINSKFSFLNKNEPKVTYLNPSKSSNLVNYYYIQNPNLKVEPVKIERENLQQLSLPDKIIQPYNTTIPVTFYNVEKTIKENTSKLPSNLTKYQATVKPRNVKNLVNLFQKNKKPLN
jgi:hypothetical protein